MSAQEIVAREIAPSCQREFPPVESSCAWMGIQKPTCGPNAVSAAGSGVSGVGVNSACHLLYPPTSLPPAILDLENQGKPGRLIQEAKLLPGTQGGVGRG
jgi:hypothetical protein